MPKQQKKRKNVNRTVQYWRIVDGPTGDHLEEADWDEFLRRLEVSPNEQSINGFPISGKAYRLNVTEHWNQSLAITDIDDAVTRADQKVTLGLVLASPKDFVPNQQNAASGVQRALSLAGSDWFPVDNLFVWFLPFGNIIGILAESISSSRASTFADWLTRVAQERHGDSDISYRVVPVVDKERSKVLKQADGLRSFNIAGEIGDMVTDAPAVKQLFKGQRTTPKAIRIELKVSLVNGKSDYEDQAELLDWFSESFGDLEGATKAQAVVAAGEHAPRTEIDLIQQRLTRKTKIPIDLGLSQAFTPMSAVGAIIDAFVKDRSDLVRLRDNDD